MGKKVVDVAVAIIVNYQNQVLLTKRNNSQSFAGMWEFPGGKVEAERSFKEAVIREVKDEFCYLGLTGTIKTEEIRDNKKIKYYYRLLNAIPQNTYKNLIK